MIGSPDQWVGQQCIVWSSNSTRHVFQALLSFRPIFPSAALITNLIQYMWNKSELEVSILPWHVEQQQPAGMARWVEEVRRLDPKKCTWAGSLLCSQLADQHTKQKDSSMPILRFYSELLSFWGIHSQEHISAGSLVSTNQSFITQKWNIIYEVHKILQTEVSEPVS